MYFSGPWTRPTLPPPRWTNAIAIPLLALIFIAGNPVVARAQFVETSSTLPALEFGTTDWGDFDNDGDLDLIVSGRNAAGSDLSRLYRNDGGTFGDVNASIAGVERSSVAWGDYDGDGDLDCILSGLDSTSTPITRLYRNDGGLFSDVNAGFPGVSDGSVAWGDADGDGDLDLVVSGLDGAGQPLTRLYLNSFGVFADAGAALAEVSQSSVAWADYDTDGDLDLLLTGRIAGGAPLSVLYRNDAGAFVNSQVALAQVYDGAVAWMDADNDGDLDVALTGRNSGANMAVYMNMGGGSFSEVLLLFSMPLFAASVSWGDYDADGDPDLLITGMDGGQSARTYLYRFDGGTSYSLQMTGLADVKEGAARWGDYDNDGRLDIVMLGSSGSGPVAHLYHNAFPGANTPPSAPGNLVASYSNGIVTFSWNSAGDGQTPTAGLGYNLRIGSGPTSENLLPGHSNHATGYRRIVRPGNVGQVLSWSIPYASLATTNDWSVQAIDASLAGSAFGSTGPFPVPSQVVLGSNPNPSNPGQTVTLTATISPATATGDVTFRDGETVLGTTPASGGAAVLSTTVLTVGTHSLTAIYQGDFETAGSTSPIVEHTVVQPPPEPTTTGLASSQNPSVSGQTVTFTATVSPAAATGTVSFTSDGAPIGAGTLNAGTATVATSTLAGADTHSILAVYSGDATYAGSTSSPISQHVLQSTTTVLTSNPNPSLFTQAVTLTASVTPPTATGTVAFKEGSSTIATATLAGGIATRNVSTLAPRHHGLTAVYAGNGQYAGSTSDVLDQNVLIATTLTLTSAPNPSVTGQNVELTATMSPVGDLGPITFMDGVTTIGTANLSSGTAILNTSSLSAGNHELTAVYGGVEPYAPSTSPPLGLTVLVSTTTALTADPNPSILNQAVTLTATVAPPGSTGSLTFRDGSTTIGTGTLSGGVCILSISNLGVGSHALTAVYPGDGVNAGSTSPVVTQGVFVATTTTLVSSPNPSSPGQNVSLTAVTSPASATGSTAFYDGASWLGTATLSGGTAVFATSGLAAGPHALSSVYAGDATNAGSSSPPWSHSVLQPTSTDLTLSPNPSLLDEPVLLTVTIVPATATGTVTFQDGSTIIGTSDLSDGIGALTVSTLTPGLHALTASYPGNSTTAGSTSPVRNQTVLIGTTTTLTSAPNPALPGQNVALTAVVSPASAAGTVTFKDGILTLGTATLNGGTCVLNVLSLTAGLHSLTAVYAGNATNAGSTSPTTLQTILAQTTTTLTATPNPSGPGQSVLLTAAVSPATATGMIAFLDGADTLAIAPLTSGTATFSTSSLSSAPHTLSAAYGGDGASTPSVSPSLTQQVGTFTDIGAGLPGLPIAAGNWGDFDSDGDLDVLLSSSGILRLFRNNAGQFVEIGANLPGSYSTIPAWGDYDNDGDLDLLLPGNIGQTYLLSIYRNDGSSFVDIGAGLPGLAGASVAWGDYDNDGDLDVLLAGLYSPTGSPITRIYRNDGGGFVDIGAALPGVWLGCVAWGDFDNDGDLDVLLTGATNSPIVSRIYRNDGGAFVDISAGLPALSRSSAAWGDYDNDGDIDILLAGNTGSDRISRVYRNDSGSFTDVEAGLPGIDQGSVTWGDQDNDGDLDLALTGDTGTGPLSRIYRNDNAGFVDAGANLPDAVYGNIAWGDYDNDGRLDLLVAGTSAAGYMVRIFHNNLPASNTTPLAPTGLQAQISGLTATFSWDAATDAETPAPGLTYNLRLGTTPGGNQISSAMAGSNGVRRVPRIVNVNQRRSVTVSVPIAAEYYYWSVQAIDAAFAGSPFAAEQVLPRPWPFTDIGADLPAVAVDWSSAVAWGDYDNDGDLDIVMAGAAGPEHIARVYRNDAGSFVDIAAGLPGVYQCMVAWGDYDRDDDLDLLLCGSTGAEYVSNIYRNDGGSFTDISAGLVPIAGGSVAWADYDNDGDLDLLMSGAPIGGGMVLHLYRNEAGTFVDVPTAMPGVSSGSVAWGDYDNDGDLDVLLTGYGSNPTSRIYRNDGGSFADIGAGLPNVYGGCGVWGDYDNDGDVDILLTGLQSPGNVFVTRVYRNDGGTFADAGAGLPGIVGCAAAWGDFDNDGDLDILATGYTATTRVSRVFRNDGGHFVDIGAGLWGVNSGSVAWGDYDNDGDLDILLTGTTGYRVATSRIYRNNSTTANTVPSAPTNLSVERAGNVATFSWDAATDAQTPAAGLTYNLRIGTTPGGSEISSAMAGPVNGYRRVAALGNTNHRRSWSVTLPAAAQYFWSVQAVDAAFAGAPFAPERVFPTSPACTEVAAGLTGVTGAAVAWADYDNDGDLDLVLAGDTGAGRVSRIYGNEGGSLVDVGAGLVGVSEGSVAWSDYDNDGDSDLLLTGFTGSGYVGLIYRNDGGTFTEIAAGLPGVAESAVGWVDHDNDGRLELLLTGFDGSASISRIYRNTGGGWVDIGAGLPGVRRGAVAWADYDNDGDVDLLLSGLDAGDAPLSRIYRNDGGSLVDADAGLVAVSRGSAGWGDYDNDGDADLLLTGLDATNQPLTRLYRNTAGTFDAAAGVSVAGVTRAGVNAGAGLIDVAEGSVAWGDYDNDGDLDALLTGSDAGGLPLSRVYRNDDGAFADSEAGLSGSTHGSVGWGDYDNDGDLDILMAGASDSSSASHLYQNNATNQNTPPTAPTSLVGELSGSTATFSWSAATDAETPAAGLTYNLRIGTTPAGGEIVPGLSDAVTGYRRVPRPGNAGQRLAWSITLPAWPAPGPIYWSVQAVDAAFAGSPWATGNVSAVEPGPDLPAAVTLYPVTPSPFNTETHIRFDLPKRDHVSLAVYDVRGRLVRVLRDETLPAGRHVAVWDGTDGPGHPVVAGIYLIQMRGGKVRETRRVVWLP